MSTSILPLILPEYQFNTKAKFTLIMSALSKFQLFAVGLLWKLNDNQKGKECCQKWFIRWHWGWRNIGTHVSLRNVEESRRRQHDHDDRRRKSVVFPPQLFFFGFPNLKLTIRSWFLHGVSEEEAKITVAWTNSGQRKLSWKITSELKQH